MSIVTMKETSKTAEIVQDFGDIDLCAVEEIWEFSSEQVGAHIPEDFLQAWPTSTGSTPGRSISTHRLESTLGRGSSRTTFADQRPLTRPSDRLRPSTQCNLDGRDRRPRPKPL